MESIEESREVDAPIATCWEVLTDPALGADWLAFADQVETEGERGVGQVLHAKGSLAGVPLSATSEVDVFEEPHRFGWSGKKPFPTQFRFALTEIDAERTKVDSSVELQPGKLPVPKMLLKRAVRKQAADSADALKALMEQRAG